MAEYSRRVLQIIVAQICQSIGWRSIHSTPLEFMVDLLHDYLWQLAYISNEYAKVLGRTDVNLDDVGLAFQHMNIDLNQLAEYVENVRSIPCAIQIPKYPVPREDHLNFMKPGSREVIKRPMHVPEYLPPMYSNLEELSPVEKKETIFENDENINVSRNVNSSIGSSVENQMSTVINNKIPGVMKRPGDTVFNSFGPDKRIKMSDETKTLREIQSVTMTTSGFLKSARRGKLPESCSPSEVSIVYDKMEELQNYTNAYYGNSFLSIDTPTFSTNNDVEFNRMPTSCYVYSQDDMTPPATPEIPKTPEIKISKVESLASVSQEQSFFKDFGIAPTIPFSMNPVLSTDGPGLIPYVINAPSTLRLPLSPIQSYVKSINANPRYEFPSISGLENQYSLAMSPKKLDKSSKKYKNDTKNKSLKKKEKGKNCVEIGKEKNNYKKKKIKTEDNGVKVEFELDLPASKSTTIKKSQSKIDEKKEESRNINSTGINLQLKLNSTASKHVMPKNSVKKTAVKKINKNNTFSAQLKELKVDPNEIKPPITGNQFFEEITLKPLPKKVALASKPVKEKIKKVKSDDCPKKSLKDKKTVRKSVEETVPVISPTIVGPDGQQIWICPACSREDNGTPMIGCDDCDAWYHWICVGMRAPPPHDANWYCKRCITRRINSISNQNNQKEVEVYTIN
ncbi:transcription initiation factor TFIID subunit 3 [Microplitis demolitor]|uniref:transcription initiation factor TFIID subunit 3 n=1 Tax=Microplitis demolitor TaxID=69319 RepID=UPI0004CCAEA5|nr:transcription initiation factor TFIID subunit 3 [Microplitis demolitor]